jgi:hypothetical protein
MGGNTRPWYFICPRCGIREKMPNKSHAESNSNVHNSKVHRNQMIAFAERE